MTNKYAQAGIARDTAPVPNLMSVLGSAGLPRPAALSETDAAEVREGRQFDSLIGSLTHRLIGTLVPLTRGASNIETGRLLAEHLADAVPADRRLGNIQAARSRVAGMTSMYLQQIAPGRHVQFLGAEIAANTGRIDLAWECPTLGVFFDELKTWRHVLPTLDRDTVQQIDRYRTFGNARFGSRFAGVRLLPLGALPQALWITPDGLTHRLTESAAAPVALRLGAAA